MPNLEGTTCGFVTGATDSILLSFIIQAKNETLNRLLKRKIMGQILRVQTALIRPTELRLSGEKFSKALFEYRNGGFNMPPIVKEGLECFYQVDGNHRITIANLLDGEVEVYVPDNKTDLLTRAMAPRAIPRALEDTNLYIKHRLPHVEIFSRKIEEEEGITSYKELHEHHGFVTIEDIERFCGWGINIPM